MKRTTVLAFTSLFILFHLSVSNSYSTEGILTQFTINKNQVEASIKVENCFNYDLEEIILNGIPVKLLFDIKLYCQSRYWFDREISSLRINHTIKYDNLKDVFIIYSDKVEPPVEVDDLTEAELLATSANNLKIAAQEVLNPKKNYYIKYKVEIEADTENSRLPSYLEYLLKLFQW
jgi:hypothetical protein